VLPGTIEIKDISKPTLCIKSGGGWKDVVVWNPYGEDKLA